MKELLDLPDEMILAIINRVKPKFLLLCSLIGTGNNRLERIVLEKSHSLDLTFDYYKSPYEAFMKRFYAHAMPCIYNNIQFLAFNLQHLIDISTFAEENCGGNFPNLTHLKIMIGKKCIGTGTAFTLGEP
ncbi:unnamed protein product [Adineta steineri]|uniref:F-box domain-containing protein n=1 Tax=Adineta steineri TaxID=433720 RepID=A0A815XUA7_9BILA|nr:unnamed protein product [Adineta steineri]CAF1665101.1 unnamed protein product [Adineta steineri]